MPGKCPKPAIIDGFQLSASTGQHEETVEQNRREDKMSWSYVEELMISLYQYSQHS